VTAATVTAALVAFVASSKRATLPAWAIFALAWVAAYLTISVRTLAAAS
jgi:hypothetical protein